LISNVVAEENIATTPSNKGKRIDDLPIGTFMDRKNEIVIEGFEDKIKKLEDSLKEKDNIVEAEVEKNVKLSEIMTNLRDRCFGFATQCIAWLKGIFNSVGAASEEVTPSAEDITGALEHIEKE
ncbi:hypothetical protein ACJX0J_020590, partial [Zea mays]